MIDADGSGIALELFSLYFLSQTSTRPIGRTLHWRHTDGKTNEMNESVFTGLGFMYVGYKCAIYFKIKPEGE